MTDLQSASLDLPGEFAPSEQIQLADRIAWMAGAHELPAYDGYPDDNPAGPSSPIVGS